jgi:hypothetical protein
MAATLCGGKDAVARSQNLGVAIRLAGRCVRERRDPRRDLTPWFATTRRQGGQLLSAKCALEVLEQIADVLQTDGDPQHAVGDADREASLRSKPPVRGRGRVRNH